MADQTTTHDDAAHAHDDELIHVPKGHSRFRYLATIGLVLFLLVIFVVADMFSTTMTGSGGSGRSDEVVMAWEDPIDGEEQSIDRREYDQVGQMLDRVMYFGRFSGLALYSPPSALFAKPDESPRPDKLERGDIASFIIYEDMAVDAGVRVSDDEALEVLGLLFRNSDEALAQAAKRWRTSESQILEEVRRVLRVSNFTRLIQVPLYVEDSVLATERWSDKTPNYKFEIASVKSEDFKAEAEAMLPADEELITWWDGRPEFEKNQLFTQPRALPEVVYLDISGDEVTADALLAAYPPGEGVDVDQQAQTYFDLNKQKRFLKPAETAPEENEDGTEKVTIQTPYEFEEVAERAKQEAQIKAAFDSFLTDVSDRNAEAQSNEEATLIDLAAEAAALGLTYVKGPEEGFLREEMSEAELWGSRDIAAQLAGYSEGTILPRVIVSKTAMATGRVLTKMPRAERPFAEIRDDVAERWVKARSTELSVEKLDQLRETLAARPEDNEDGLPWIPTIDGTEFATLVRESGYEFYDRPALGRGETPKGSPTAADRHLAMQSNVWNLEAGQVPPPSSSRDGSTSFLVHFTEKTAKAVAEMTATTHLSEKRTERSERAVEFGRSALRGDGAWLTERTKLRWPAFEDEDSEGESASTDNN